jgi:putative MATE family efflux protein
MSAPPAATRPAPEAASATWGGIWRLSWPLVLTMVANAGVGLLETWIAGHFGAVEQAVVGLTMQLVLLINALTTAVAIGAQALVSRFVGAGEWAEAGRAARQAVLLGLALSVGLLPLVWLAAPGLYAVLGAPEAVQQAGAPYLRSLVIGLLPMDILIVLHAVLRARGLSIGLLGTAIVENLVWMAGSLGAGLGLGLGLPGLAVGFVAGKVAGLAVAWAIFSRMQLYREAAGGWRPAREWFGRLLRIGSPSAVQVLMRNVGMMAFFGILGLLPVPTAVVAAFSIGMRVEAVAFLPCFALNIAAATLVGQNLGAGRPDDAARATWRVAAVGIVVMTGFAVLFWFGAEALAARFTADPLVRGHVAEYLRVAAISEPFLALAMVLNGALQGAGDARAPMWSVLVFQLMLRVPLGYALALPLGWGTSGAWWAMTVSMVAQGLGITWYFRLGRWRHTRV